MKRRVRSQLPDQDLGRITTFHGFCVGLLKEDCHVLQYPSTFIVLDEEDKEAILPPLKISLLTGRKTVPSLPATS